MKLQNKVALITGSATGIGAATAQLFASEGAAVAINYPVEAQAAEAASVVEAITAAGGKAFAVRADVSDADDVQAMIDGILERHDRLDILMNNAGVNNYKRIQDLSLEEWNRTLAVNLTGPFLCIKTALPSMLAQGGGIIINVASIAPWYAGPTIDYNASKSGVVAMTRTVAKQFGRQGIRCNTIAPGYHDTSLARGLVDSDIKITYWDDIPLGFRAGPDSLAKVALFLASDDSSYVQGHTLVSDGGVLML